MSKIIIQVYGGLIQGVFIKGTGRPTSAIVVDEDTEGTNDYISYTGKDNDTHKACIHTESILKLLRGSDMDSAVKLYEKTIDRDLKSTSRISS